MNTSLQTHWSRIRPGRTLFLTGLLRGWLAIFLLWSGLAPAQSIDPTFNPGLGANSPVISVAVQADGKVLIGGDFTQYNGTARSRIARINADGSLDTGFNPGLGANSPVISVAVQADGKVLIGGNFTQYNGTARNRIARLNADGSLDTGFNPGLGANNFVYSVAAQADGKVLIGGNFTQYNGTARSGIARLNTDGSLDTGFNPGSGTNSTVRSVAAQADGQVLIGGEFTQYNGTARNRIARINANGSLDTGFNPGSGASNTVYSVVVKADGKVLIGGDLTQYNGTTRNRIARLNADGSLDTGFDPGLGPNGTVLSVAVQADGKVLIGGGFIARLNTDGSLDTGFNPGSGPSGTVFSLAVQADSKVLLGGGFTQYNGTARNNIARLLASPLTLTGFVASPASVCVGNVASFTATVGNVTGSYSYTLTNGTSPATGTATSATFSQGLVAGGTGPQTFTLTVSNGSQPTSATTPLTVTQCLTLTGLNPARNARSAPQTTNVSLTFNQGLNANAATLGGMRVFSAQRGGLLRNGPGGSASVNGSTLSFNPATNFKPGETVFVTSTTAIQGAGGARLSRGQVHQFTTGVGGTGRGNFTPPATNPNLGVGSTPNSVAFGDLDGDGDLDFVTANQNSDNVSVRLNDGSGNFTPPATNPEPGVGRSPISMAVGDVDGDGDLDFVTANFNGNTVSVRLNDGSGNFTPHPINPEPGVGVNPFGVALGDVDGDGNLDLLCANSSGNTVSVRLNNGLGNFTPPAINPEIGVGSSPQSVALGDVDGDGDLDLLCVNTSGNTVSVRLNDGSGNFTPPATNPEIGVGSRPGNVALGDVDGDGDLDLLTANRDINTVSVRLNDGSGNFTAPATNPEPGVGRQPLSVELGDVDGDGDLDLLTANLIDFNVSVRLNDGSGNFTAPATNPNPSVVGGPNSVALGDVDGDGDLDLITANAFLSSNTVSVRLNRPLPLTLTGLSASPNPVCVGQPLSVTASVGNLSGSYSYTLSNGSNPISGTATNPAFSQPLTASGSGVQTFTLTVSSEGQVATATTSLTVNAPPSPTLISSGTLTCASPSVTLTASGGDTYRFSNGATQIGNGPTATVTMSGLYSVTVTSANGCTASASTSVSADQSAPSVSISPSSATLNCASPSVSLTATGSGSFRWSTGSTDNEISVSSAGTYSVTLTSGSGCTAVASAQVSQQPDQTIAFTQQPASASSVTVGTSVSTAVSVSGNPTAFQWFKDNDPVGGQTSATLTLPNVQLTDAGNYRVVVTGTCNSLTSTAFSLSVTPVQTAPFAITAVTTLSCTPILPNRFSVSFTPRYAGLNGQPVAFAVDNELLPTTEPGPYTLQLYTDNPTLTLKATQGNTPPEARFVYNWLAACQTSQAPNTPPRVVSPLSSQTATVGTYFTYVIPDGTFTDTETPLSLRLSASGVPAGLSFSGATLSGVPATTVGSPFSLTITATDPGNLSASTFLPLTVLPATTTPQPTQPFAITGVSTISCTPVADRININFTPRYVGMTGQSIAFEVVNELAPTTDGGPYALTLYRDNPVLTLKATQTGSVEVASFRYDWLAACASVGQDNTPPRLNSPVASQTATVGQGYSLNLSNTFADQETPNQITLVASGLPAGFSLVGTTLSGTPSVSGVSTVVLTATDPGSLSASTSFMLTVSPASSGTTTAPFAITGVSTLSCAVLSGGQRRVSFTPQYSGTTGQPISFSVVNELAPTTNAGPYSLSLYTDNPTITLSARQGSATTTYAYAWLASCLSGSGARWAAPELGPGLQVVVLGNPLTGQDVSVEVAGAEGQTLRLSLTNLQGQPVSERLVERAGTVERQTLRVEGQPAGVLLLRVSTPYQTQTVKVLKR